MTIPALKEPWDKVPRGLRIDIHNRYVQLAWHGCSPEIKMWPDVSDCKICEECGIIHEFGW